MIKNKYRFDYLLQQVVDFIILLFIRRIWGFEIAILAGIVTYGVDISVGFRGFFKRIQK